MNVAYRKLVAMSPEIRDLMRQVLARSLHRGNQAIENSFMSLYSALETIVLVFRRTNGLEYVLPDVEWNPPTDPKAVAPGGLKADLEIYIRGHYLLRSRPQQQDWLCANLPGLNRVTFSTALRRFLKACAVNVDGLWPVIGGSATLSAIRNRLTHGEHVTSAQSYALWVACCNLKWVVERSIMAMLDWPSDRSNASTGRLAGGGAIPYMTWKTHQGAFRS